MAVFLDGHTMSVRCPSCGRKTVQTIGWIKTHKRMACAGCQTTISLHSAELVSEIKRVENMLDDFARAGRRH